MDKDPLAKAKHEARHRGIGNYKRHILICIGPDCCSHAEGDAAWKYLKKRTAELNGSSDRGAIYRSKVGCLRICKDGPIAVVYPEGTWYGGLTRKNLERVIDEDLAQGKPVEDLIIGRNPL